MDTTTALAALLAGPDPRLDLAWALLSAHADPSLDVEATVGRLDELADACPGTDIPAMCEALFGPGRFVGNRGDYYDPANSLLPAVLDRRMGIPISLSVVAMEVGRRHGLRVAGVGMPGHFIVADVEQARFADPFNARADLSADDCRALFESLHGTSVPFDPVFLRTTPTTEILARMIANLRVAYQRRHDRSNLAWVLGVAASRPGATADDHRLLAETLAGLGRFDRAADAAEHAAVISGSSTDSARAVALRARLN